MKLTVPIRKAFVRAVVDALPSLGTAEEISANINTLNRPFWPTAISQAYDDPEARLYLNTYRYYFDSTVYFDGWSMYLTRESPTYIAPTDFDVDSFPPTTKVFIDDIQDKLNQRKRFAEGLYAAVQGISTLKKLRETFPEFVKFMPEEVAPTKNLPAHHDLVAKAVELGLQVTA